MTLPASVSASVARVTLCRGEARQGGQELGVVVLVRGILARVAARSNAGKPAQRIDLQPRVVGQRREARAAGIEARLERRVRRERGPGLVRLVGDPGLVQGDQLRVRRPDQVAQLAQLVTGPGRDEQARAGGGDAARGSTRCCRAGAGHRARCGRVITASRWQARPPVPRRADRARRGPGRAGRRAPRARRRAPRRCPAARHSVRRRWQRR